ncbi:hypothetical protein THOB06_10515 [Vibrio rotiferianus]|nr:hypothetical protein THOB06_10515 [Vibrio rotiferianus]
MTIKTDQSLANFWTFFEFPIVTHMTGFRFEKYGMALNLWPIFIGHNGGCRQGTSAGSPTGW